MKEQILELVNEILPHVDFLSSDKLVTDGILDSLSIVTLVSELSVEFDVEFSLDELSADNMDSIDAIVKTVESLQKNR